MPCSKMENKYLGQPHFNDTEGYQNDSNEIFEDESQDVRDNSDYINIINELQINLEEESNINQI